MVSEYNAVFFCRRSFCAFSLQYEQESPVFWAFRGLAQVVVLLCVSPRDEESRGPKRHTCSPNRPRSGYPEFVVQTTWNAWIVAMQALLAPAAVHPWNCRVGAVAVRAGGWGE